MERLIALMVVLVLVGASESPYIGKIQLREIEDQDINNVLQFTPVTQQPKIANFQHNWIQFDRILQQSMCTGIPQLIDPHNQTYFAIINIAHLKKPKCSLVQQIKNSKRAGYKGFIFATDQDFVKNHCRMYDDNNFFIGVMDSDNFKILEEYQKKGKETAHSFLTKGLLSIHMKNSQKNLLQVWVNSLNQASYDTLWNIRMAFRQIPSLQEKVKWNVRFATFNCKKGQTARACSNNFISSCGCKGQFCSPQLRERTSAPMVKQDMRQYFILKAYKTKYFDYAHFFNLNCLQLYKTQKYIDDCSTKTMNKLQMDSNSINQQVKSFLDECDNKQIAKNSQIYLDFQKDQRAFISYHRYPLVLVNKQIIAYQDQQDFNSKVCQNLGLEDNECDIIVDRVFQTQSLVSILFWVLLTITLILAALAVVYFYKKKLKRDVNKEIKMQVSTAVQHYFALTQASSTK